MNDKPWRDNYLNTDPLPKILSGLLNSQEIREYAKLKLLVSEFDEKRLKSASYEMSFYGELHYWEYEDDRLKKKFINLIDLRGQKFVLRRNSIAYIYLREEFRLPHYIAARFNLHIRHVHKGLLLGTGPLVDPGFDGRLLIPLHNLTETNYEIDIGDGLIWVEFTKLNGAADKPFPETKLGLSPLDYFDKADVLKAGGVLSSIGMTLESSRNASQKHQDLISKVQNIGFSALAFAVVTVVISVGALLFTAWQFYSSVN